MMEWTSEKYKNNLMEYENVNVNIKMSKSSEMKM